jgi:hypothetical protein
MGMGHTNFVIVGCFLRIKLKVGNTWNIRSLYSVDSLMTVLRELSRYRLDLVGVQEVRWEGSGTIPAGEYELGRTCGMNGREEECV